MQLHKLSIACVLVLFCSTVASAKILFRSTREGNGEIYVMNDDGSEVRRLTNTPLSDAAPRWSPDGRTIAFATDMHSAGAGQGQQYDLFIMDADGSNLQRLTDHPALDGHPSWSPDGHRLAFSSTRNGDSSEIYVMDISSGEVEQLTDSIKVDGYASSPNWSPDGKHIAYELARAERGRDIYIMDANGKNAKSLANRKAPLIRGQNTVLRHFPRWSPDGRRLLYTEVEHGIGFRLVSTQLVVRRSDGSNPQALPIPKGWMLNSGCWAADGTEIIFGAVENGLVKPSGNYDIYRYNRFSGEITNLANHPSREYGPDWFSDNLSVSLGGKLSTLWGAIKRETSQK